MPVLVASFGASAVLVFGVPNSPFSQPRSLVGEKARASLTSVRLRLPGGAPGRGSHLVALSACALVRRAGGQLVCALTGVVVRNIFHAAPASVLPVSAAVGMATAQVLMLATRTTHPPGAPPTPE